MTRPHAPLSTTDSATWLGLRACLIDVTREEVRQRMYKGRGYIVQLDPEKITPHSDLLAYARDTLERSVVRRESVDDKAKIVGGLVTFFIPICVSLASRLGLYSFAIVLPLGCFGTSLMLVLAYFRLGIMAQPSVSADDARLDQSSFQAQLISDLLRAADQNERRTSFQADVFRAAVRSLVVGIALLAMMMAAVGR